MSNHRLLAQRAASQNSLITRRQALSSGLTAREIEVLLQHGALDILRDGVYAIAGVPISYRKSLHAAVLLADRDSVASHRAGCEIWDLGLPMRPPCEITVGRTRSARTPGVVVHRPVHLAERHTTVRHGIPVTTVARTLADLGAVSREWLVRRAVETSLTRRLVTIAELEAIVCELSRRGRRGVGTLRRVLGSRNLGARPADSPLEVAMADLTDRAGLPRPEFQYEIEVGGRVRRIDFAYPNLLIAIEVDGWADHMKLDRFRDDRVRANGLALLGWTVIRFTWDDIVNRPDYVVATMHSILGLSP